MTTLVAGASGATGRLLVEQLLERGQEVRAIVRSAQSLPDSLRSHRNLEVIQAAVLDLGGAEMAHHVEGCNAVASCLGHNLTFRGLFGPPHRLVTDAVRRLCRAVLAHPHGGPTRFVLMNTTAVRNHTLQEPASFGHRWVIGLLRLLLPPHVDNERAADFLRTEIGPGHRAIEWAAVRPDNLTHEDQVTAYDLHPSPIRDAIFDPGKTSRINVAHFMARLITEDDLWQQWKGQMPVIYNQENQTAAS